MSLGARPGRSDADGQLATPRAAPQASSLAPRSPSPEACARRDAFLRIDSTARLRCRSSSSSTPPTATISATTAGTGGLRPELQRRRYGEPAPSGRLTVTASDANEDRDLGGSAPARRSTAAARRLPRDAHRGRRDRAYEEKIDPHLAGVAKNIVWARPRSSRTTGHHDGRHRHADLHPRLQRVVVGRRVVRALALQASLNRTDGGDPAEGERRAVHGPSDGMALPLVSYKSTATRPHARSGAFSSCATSSLSSTTGKTSEPVCGPGHPPLFCHSMGSYVLQNAEAYYSTRRATRLPRALRDIFLCAPDVDDNVLEIGAPLGDARSSRDA